MKSGTKIKKEHIISIEIKANQNRSILVQNVLRILKVRGCYNFHLLVHMYVLEKIIISTSTNV